VEHDGGGVRSARVGVRAVALWRNRDEDFGLEVGLHRNYGSLKGQLGLDVDVEIDGQQS
jgi:hypothetical protein